MPISTQLPQIAPSDEEIALVVCKCSDVVMKNITTDLKNIYKLVRCEPFTETQYLGDIDQWWSIAAPMNINPLTSLMQNMATDNPAMRVMLTNFDDRERLAACGVPYYYIINIEADQKEYMAIAGETNSEKYSMETIIPLKIPTRNNPEGAMYSGIKYILSIILRNVNKDSSDVCFTLAKGRA